MATDLTVLTREVVHSVAPVVPFLVEMGEKVVATEAIKRVGAASWELAKDLWVKIYPQLSKQAGFQDVVLDIAQDPDDEDTRGALRRQLKKLLTEDAELASELETLLKATQQSANTAIASGTRSVAIGGNASGTFINTGDNNRFP